MNIQDWVLVVFTILAQMSVGSFLVLGFVHFFAARTAGIEEADRLSDRALIAIGPVLILGLLASLLHLGDPLNAYRAVSNLGTSWLSREILFGVAFALLGALFALLQWRKIGTPGVRNIVAWLAAIVGLGLVYSMANVYLIPAQPVWNTFATPVTFFTTTFLLGALATGAAFVANYTLLKNRQEGDLQTQLSLLRGSLRWIAIVSILLLGVELVVTPVYLALLSTGGGAALSALNMLIGEFAVLLVLRLVLVFIGAGVFGLFLYQNALVTEKGEGALGTLAYSAFGLVLVAEVLGRFLFYATHVRVGI